MSQNDRNYIFLTLRIKKVMKALVNAETPLKIVDIANRTESSPRLVYYDLDFVNMYLQRKGYPRIEPVDSTYFVTKQQREYLNEMISESVRVGEKDNRLSYIICSLIFQQNKITINYLSILLGVSRNTIVTDLQEATEILKEFGLKVLNNKSKGYYVEGDIYTKRYVFIHYLSIFTKSSNYHFMNTFNEDDIQEYIDNVSLILDSLSIKIKKREIIVFAYLMLAIRVFDSRTIDKEIEIISSSKEYELVCKYFSYLNQYEKYCFSLLFMSITKSKTIHTDNEDIIYNLSKRIIDQYEQLEDIKFIDYDTLVYKMYKNLMFIDYCYSFDLPIPYVFTETIKKNRDDIYKTVENIIAALRMESSFPIYDQQIAFISLLIATYIPYNHHKSKKRVLICTNNILDLKDYLIHEIQSISEEIEIVDVIDSSYDIKQYSYDYLISTLNYTFDTERQMIISEIISSNEKKRISEWMDYKR